MKTIVMIYLIAYLLTVLGIAVYSFVLSKRMPLWRFLLVCVCCIVIATCLREYAQAYHPGQMVIFALSFTGMSTLFMANGLGEKASPFWVFFGFNCLRLIIHIQLLLFLYLFR